MRVIASPRCYVLSRAPCLPPLSCVSLVGQEAAAAAVPLRDGEEISVVSSLEGSSVANKRSSGQHMSSGVDPNAKVKLTCSVALLNISLRPDAEAIFLEQVRGGRGNYVSQGPFVRRASVC